MSEEKTTKDTIIQPSNEINSDGKQEEVNNKGEETAIDSKDESEETAHDSKDKSEETAIGNEVKSDETALDSKSKGEETVHDSKDKSEETVDNSKSNSEETAHDSKSKSEETAHDSKSKSEETANDNKDKSEETVNNNKGIISIINLVDDDTDEEDDDKEEKRKDSFITSSVEKAMGDYWPQPTSEYYCRCCNYLEFPNEEMLKEHGNAEDHKHRLSNQHEAFCLICQVHTYDKSIMEKHCKIARHNKLTQIFVGAEVAAKLIWERIKSNGVSLRKENDNPCNDKKDKKDEEITNISSKIGSFSDVFQKRICAMKIRLEKFFEENDASSSLEHVFVDLAKLAVMKEEWVQPTTMFSCRVCNAISFASKQEKVAHYKTASHKLHDKAKHKFRCKQCDVTLLSYAAFAEHRETQHHKEMQILVTYAKEEALKHALEKRGNITNDPMTLIQLRTNLYPKDNFRLKDNGCSLCNRSMLNSEHFIQNKHQKLLKQYYNNICLNGMTFSRGCALCNHEGNDFNIDQHISSLTHEANLQSYREEIGLLSSGEWKKNKQRNQRNSQDNLVNKNESNGNTSTKVLYQISKTKPLQHGIIDLSQSSADSPPPAKKPFTEPSFAYSTVLPNNNNNKNKNGIPNQRGKPNQRYKRGYMNSASPYRRLSPFTKNVRPAYTQNPSPYIGGTQSYNNDQNVDQFGRDIRPSQGFYDNSFYSNNNANNY